MRRTILSTALAAALLVPVGAAHASPQDDEAELSQTIQVAWAMPGPFRGFATFPQTYLPGGVPECGTGGVQVDVYKYGTDEVRALVDALVAGGVLTSPADDARVAAGRLHWFVALEPCPGDPGDPTGPPETGVEGTGGTVTTVAAVTPVVVPAAGAVPVAAVPRYAG